MLHQLYEIRAEPDRTSQTSRGVDVITVPIFLRIFLKHDELIVKESTIAQAHRGHGSALVRAVCHSFISKVVVLYQRALRETKGNVGLWLRFATFCYQHGNRRLLSRVITQALQMNPSCAGLWAFAAFWEYTSQVPQRTDFSSYPSSWKAIIQALKN